MYPLECYRCGKAGEASEFPLPRQCPDCGSYEVHHPDAGSLTKPKQETS